MGKLKSDDIAEEFEEEEIWAVLHNNTDNTGRGRSRGVANNDNKKGRENIPPVGAPPSRCNWTASLMIPRSHPHPHPHPHPTEGEEGIPLWRPLSAPMNIPDWSQIKRIIHDEVEQMEEEEEEEEEKEMVPPHEVITRQLARSQMKSFSMCEGAGRTLKGRDLSRVRNAVLTRTGFLQ